MSVWPDNILDPTEQARQWARIHPVFLDRLREHRIPETRAEPLATVYLPLAAWLLRRRHGDAYLLGVNGAQGSGKSTLCDFLALIMAELHGQRVAMLSIDDLYRTRTEREQMARAIHPLLITRGVPGTHDVALGLELIGRLREATSATTTALPAFDKARDDRRPTADWPMFRGRPDFILFEGWCVGTRPQAEADLIEPVNSLEREEDPEGHWRRYVNDQLKGDYAALFGLLDGLAMLKVPDMASVYQWRSLQEQKLAAATSGTTHRLLDTPALRRFIMHYERLTRHNLAEMPARADLTLRLNAAHQCSGIDIPPSIAPQTP